MSIRYLLHNFAIPIVHRKDQSKSFRSKLLLCSSRRAESPRHESSSMRSSRLDPYLAERHHAILLSVFFSDIAIIQ